MVTDDEGKVETALLAQRLRPLITDPDTFYVTQGFICSNEQGEIDNLGRGGSDYSAALMGAAIEANQVQIWTDIDGMHNNDPRYVENTYPIRKMSFDEAAELAYFGAKILHPSTIQPCKDHGISVLLKNTMDPDAPGTTISLEEDRGRAFHAVAAKDGITVIRIYSARMLMAYGFLRKVFEVFEAHRTPIDMITTSEVAVSLTVDNDKHLRKLYVICSRWVRSRLKRITRSFVSWATWNIARRVGFSDLLGDQTCTDQDDLLRCQSSQYHDVDRYPVQETNLAVSEPQSF